MARRFKVGFREYGFEYRTVGDRLRRLEESLQRIRARLPRLSPPLGKLPVLIGGAGEKVTLQLALAEADALGDEDGLAVRAGMPRGPGEQYNGTPAS